MLNYMFATYGKRIDCRGLSQPSTKDRFINNALRPVRYLISSSSQHYGHPDADTIELILKHHEGGQPELVFNYLSPKTQPWRDHTLQQERGYEASFPSDASWGV